MPTKSERSEAPNTDKQVEFSMENTIKESTKALVNPFSKDSPFMKALIEAAKAAGDAAAKAAEEEGDDDED